MMIAYSAIRRFYKDVTLIAAALLLLIGCAGPREPLSVPPLVRLMESEYPTFGDDLNYAQLNAALDQSLVYYRRLPAERRMAFGPEALTVQALIDSLLAFADLVAAQPDQATLNSAIRRDFLVYRAAGRKEDQRVLFTGYYEPLLAGNPTPDKHFPVAVLSRPADLVEIDLTPFAPDLAGRRIVGRYADRTVVPYPDRGRIRRWREPNGIAPPIAWLRDEIDLLILQIQGSGRIAFANGHTLAVRYDGSNGRPYQSIGRVLIDRGYLKPENASMQNIRRFLRDHPELRDAVIEANPRYIFFRLSQGGPFGSLNVPLTRLRSIAVDQQLFPPGAPAFIQVPLPAADATGRIAAWPPHQGFVVVQDSGQAIKGPGRVDLFWGGGEWAETAAGHLKNPGDLFFILHKKALLQ